MGDRMSLTSDDIVQPIRSGSINKAIADPLARLDDLCDIGLQLERLLHSLVVQLASVVEVRSVGIAVETEDVERVLARDGDEVAGAGPVDLLKEREGGEGSAVALHRKRGKEEKDSRS